MCDPVSILAITTALSLGAQAINTSKQAHFQEQQFAATKKNADQAALLSYSQLQKRQRQEVSKAAQSINQATVQAAAARGAARTAAGEAGVAGTSVDALQNEFVASELGYQHSVTRNLAFLDAQFGSEMEAVQLQQQGRIQSAQPQPVQQPDYIGTLGNAYGKILQIQNAEKQTQPQH